MLKINEKNNEGYVEVKLNRTSHIPLHTSQKGITLIALIITIVLMLILASITVNVAINGGLFGYAKNAKDSTEIASEKETISKASILASGKSKNGNITKNNLDTELKYIAGEEKCTTEEDDDGIIVTFNESKRSYIVDKDGNVTEYVKKVPIEKPETGGKTFSRAYGTIDILFLEGTGYDVGEPNKPKIDKSTMVPVNWNGEAWVVTDEANWEYSYDETDKKWANVMLRDKLVLEEMTNAEVQKATIEKMKGQIVTTEGSMLVWIPRFCYKITYYSTSTKETVVGYSDARGLVDTEGKTPQGLADPVTTISVGDYYRPHPAFEKDLEQGGWSKRLSGIWFGKFVTTAKANGKLTIRPGQKAYTGQTIGTFYTDALDLGIANSHMAKNSEWGAMAYLTQSKYGLNGSKVGRNTSSSSGGGSGTSYITNTSLSTTANVYGIYDTYGPMSEYTSSYLADSSDTLGYGNVFTSTDNTTNNKTESTKFATVYLGTSKNGYGGNYSININKKFGDAVIETSTGGLQWNSWNGGNSTMPGMNYYGNSYNLFFTRNEQYTSGGGGPTSFSFTSGGSNGFGSFRVICCVE